MSVCREKIAYASYRYEKVPLKDRGDKKAPLITILSHRLPERLIREPGLFEKTDTRGCEAHPEIGEFRDFHRVDFDAVRDTVAPGTEVEAFDFYFDFVLQLVAKLEPLWNK